VATKNADYSDSEYDFLIFRGIYDIIRNMKEKNIQSNDYDATALLAYPRFGDNDTLEKRLPSFGRALLVRELRSKYGIDVWASHGVKKGDIYTIVRPEFEGLDLSRYDIIADKNNEELSLALNSIALIRNYTKTARLNYDGTVLNPPDLREAVRDKHKMATEFYGPSGAYGRENVIAHSVAGVSEAVTSLPGEMFVAKPNQGTLSRRIIVGDKSGVISKVRQALIKDPDNPYLVEEKIDFSSAMPGVRGENSTEQSRLDRANRDGVNKELRLYYYSDGEWDGVLRVAEPGETDFKADKWLYIDLDSIPSELLEKSQEIAKQLCRSYGDVEAHMALDWTYGSVASQPEPHWMIMEVNAGNPWNVKPGQNRQVSERQHRKDAKQIARIAKSVGK